MKDISPTFSLEQFSDRVNQIHASSKQSLSRKDESIQLERCEDENDAEYERKVSRVKEGFESIIKYHTEMMNWLEQVQKSPEEYYQFIQSIYANQLAILLEIDKERDTVEAKILRERKADVIRSVDPQKIFDLGMMVTFLEISQLGWEDNEEEMRIALFLKTVMHMYANSEFKRNQQTS